MHALSTDPEPGAPNRNPEPGIRNPERAARPLLKWAGGKRQLLPLISRLYPSTFDRYIEPFFGSGAVFFDLHASGHLTGRQVRLVDANPDLVGCYSVLRDRTDDVIDCLEVLAAGHRSGGKDFFYEIRDERFNPARACGGVYSAQLAAMLIYLNRTGFNGLFRLNRRGEFNVPAGRYVNPRICDPEHLRNVAAALRQPGVTFERGSFEQSLADARSGDFIYCDPPYAPLSRTASFASYTAGGFTAADQMRLQQSVIEAATRGATVVVSNSSAAEIVSMYTSREAQRAGLALKLVPARRAINSRAGLRGPVAEVLVTNACTKALRLRMAKSGLRAPAGVRLPSLGVEAPARQRARSAHAGSL